MRLQQVITMPIEDIPQDAPENRDPQSKIMVVISKAGREVRLPKKELQFGHRSVVMPVWLAKKILKEGET